MKLLHLKKEILFFIIVMLLTVPVPELHGCTLEL